MTINEAPIATGIITNSNDFTPRIAITGLAPAGGCVVFVINIINIARLTPSEIDKGVPPRK